MTSYSYVGSELDLFSRARNWKGYYGRLIRVYFGKEVLEVGAGIGETTRSLCVQGTTRWVCLEPDPALAEQVRDLITEDGLPGCCEIRVGTVGDLRSSETFDSILYIDVLEHIEDDASELELAGQLLKTGGFLIIVAPAHQQLFTPFDARIGHYRRYNRRSLTSIIPGNLHRRELYYVDSVGAIASLANRFVLGSNMPTVRQIAFWDKVMVPMSRVLDPLLRYSLGKSIVGIWQKS